MPLWLFGRRRRLLRTLDALAFYNDKGIAYARHSPERIEAERARGLARARALSAKIAGNELPRDVRQAIDDGDAAIDASGRYADALRAYLRRGESARTR